MLENPDKRSKVPWGFPHSLWQYHNESTRWMLFGVWAGKEGRKRFRTSGAAHRGQYILLRWRNGDFTAEELHTLRIVQAGTLHHKLAGEGLICGVGARHTSLLAGGVRIAVRVLCRMSDNRHYGNRVKKAVVNASDSAVRRVIPPW